MSRMPRRLSKRLQRTAGAGPLRAAALGCGAAGAAIDLIMHSEHSELLPINAEGLSPTVVRFLQRPS